MTRPSLHETMLDVAKVLARRATCSKLAVGCVLVDRAGHILGAGYNGVPHGLMHCLETPCKGATMPAGSDTCEAVHAEQNAMFWVSPYRVHTCYTTHAPCLRCTKMLLNTKCELLVFPDTPFEGAEIWARSGRGTIVFDATKRKSLSMAERRTLLDELNAKFEAADGDVWDNAVIDMVEQALANT